MEYTAIIEKIAENCYIASCAEIKGANTQGCTMEEVKANLVEAIRLILSTEKEISINYYRNSLRKPFYRKVTELA